MLSIQGFFIIVNTLLLLLVLGLLWKLYRAVQNCEQGPVENDREPVPLRERLAILMQDEWNYNNSVPCNRKRATEHDES